MVNFLRPSKEWRTQVAVRGQVGQPSHPASRFWALVVHSGMCRWGLFSSPSLLTPSPLFCPLLLNLCAWESGTRQRLWKTSLGSPPPLPGVATTYVQQFSRLLDLSATVSSTVLCDQLLPLLRSAIWQHSLHFSQAGRVMVSHMVSWKLAVAPLPPAAVCSRTITSISRWTMW